MASPTKSKHAVPGRNPSDQQRLIWVAIVPSGLIPPIATDPEWATEKYRRIHM
jgi:hypothetical protein